MSYSKKLKRLSSGLPDPKEIPDSLLRSRIIDYLSCTTCNLDKLADSVYRYANFKYRQQNRDMIIDRIWKCIDELINEKYVVQYETKNHIKVKLGENNQQIPQQDTQTSISSEEAIKIAKEYLIKNIDFEVIDPNCLNLPIYNHDPTDDYIISYSLPRETYVGASNIIIVSKKSGNIKFWGKVGE